MESGRIADKSLPRLLYGLAATGHTGTMRLEAAGRHYALYWAEGRLVDADSPAPEDQLHRVLRDADLIDAVALGETQRILTEQPDRPILDILVELGALQGDAVLQGAALGLWQRAARAFAAADATYEVDEAPHGRHSVAAVDVRSVVYRGLRRHYDPRRLERELGALSGRAIKLGPVDDRVLGSFGFADPERYALAYLQRGYWELADLLDACVSLPRTTVMALVYALAATDCLDVQPAESVPRLRRRAREATIPLIPGGPMPSATNARTTVVPPAHGASSPVASAALPTSPPGAPASATAVTIPAPGGTRLQRATTPPPGSGPVREQIRAKLAALDAGADHFQLLEIDRNATKEQVKQSYFQLAKVFHPDRLAALKVEDLRAGVERVFAALSEGFTTLGDEAKRKEYLAFLATGGAAGQKQREAQEMELATKILRAEDHFRAGEMALRRQMFAKALEAFTIAVELNPDEGEHHALLAWSLWASTPAEQRDRVFAQVKKGMTRALELSPKCAAAYFYLGEVMNQRGDAEAAYGNLKRALDLRPGWIEAEREIRVLEMRRSRGGKTRK